MCSRSKLLNLHLLQSWAMDLWSPGVMSAMVATAVRTGSAARCAADPSFLLRICCNPGRWICGHLGSCGHGGDSSAVQEQLRDVQQIQASTCAFAAILGDGSVVTWGDARSGGDSSAVQDQLRDVQQIQASYGTHLLQSWVMDLWSPGVSAGHGGDSSSVQDQLRDVQQIQASYYAFAAILGDGSVVTWGHVGHGGDSSSVQDQLRDVQQIQASYYAFAAILGHGSVVTWGDADG